MLPTRHQVLKALDDDRDPWMIGNAALYRLCAEHPRHTDSRAAIAKVLLIGRTYAAAIERRKVSAGGKTALGDEFYVDEVGPALVTSDLDRYLDAIPGGSDPDDTWLQALEAHTYLMGVFRILTAQGKRSLASKYLHFHRPDVFIIYDSRAVGALARFRGDVPRSALRVPAEADSEYGRFLIRALSCRQHLQTKYSLTLTPRQFDRVLLAMAASPQRNARRDP